MDHIERWRSHITSSGRARMQVGWQAGGPLGVVPARICAPSQFKLYTDSSLLWYERYRYPAAQ